MAMGMHPIPVLGKINRRWAFATCSERGFEPRPLASPACSTFHSALTQKRDICPLGEMAKVSLPLPYSQAAPDWEDKIRKLWRTPGAGTFCKPLEFSDQFGGSPGENFWMERGNTAVIKLPLSCRVEGTFYVTTKSTISEDSYLFFFYCAKIKCSCFRNGLTSEVALSSLDRRSDFAVCSVHFKIDANPSPMIGEQQWRTIQMTF